MLGYTKKGKQFYSFSLNLAEKISSLHVIDNSIWLTGEYTFTQLVDHAEAQFYIAPDRINDSDVSLAACQVAKWSAQLIRTATCKLLKLLDTADDAKYDSSFFTCFQQVFTAGLEKGLRPQTHEQNSGKSYSLLAAAGDLASIEPWLH